MLSLLGKAGDDVTFPDGLREVRCDVVSKGFFAPGQPHGEIQLRHGPACAPCAG